jgi:hypothetical protein
VRATAEDVEALHPDALILAAGARMRWPHEFPRQWAQDGLVQDLRACAAELLEFTHPQGGTAVIYDRDGTEGTYAVAELLKRLFDRVVLVTPRDRIAEDSSLIARLGILRRLADQQIECLPLAEVDAASSLEDAVIAVRNVYTGRCMELRDVALLTYATPRVPDTEAFAHLCPEVPELHVVGDAYAPGTTMTATAQGHRLGNLV